MSDGGMDEMTRQEWADYGIQRGWMGADRLNEHHTVIVSADGYRMTHPISCTMASCEFDAIAESWHSPPAPFGTLRMARPRSSPWHRGGGRR